MQRELFLATPAARMQKSSPFNADHQAATDASTPRLSLGKRVWGLALGSVMIAGLVQTGAVQRALQEQEAGWARADSEERIERIAASVHSYLEDRILVLQDLARHPVLLQELQSPGPHRGEVTVLLDERRILGDQPHLTLVDGWGQVVHQTRPLEGSASELPGLVNPLLNREITQLASIQTIGEETYLCLATPIVQADRPQGALVLNYPLHQFQKALGLQRPLEHASLSISQRGSELWVLGDQNSGEEFQREVAGTEFTLLLTQDPYRESPGHAAGLRQTPLGLLALTLLLGGTVLYLVKRWFVAPVAQLAGQTAKFGGIADLEAHDRQAPSPETQGVAVFANELADR